jgi:hypothetical protein
MKTEPQGSDYLGTQARAKSSIELYRAVTGAYSYRVVVIASDETQECLRAAKALATELEAELAERYPTRRR